MGNTIKFKVQASDLMTAVDMVSIVPPRPITPQGNTGYLLVVKKDEKGGDVCYIYSQDALRVARASFPISDVEGEGPFIYPAQHIDAFKFVEGQGTFTVQNEGDAFTVAYDFGKGTGGKRNTFDPRLLGTCDKELEAAINVREFPISLLKEGMSLSAPFTAKEKDTHVEEHFKTFQVFDASNPDFTKGDGYLYASTGVQAFFLHSDELKGKPLSLHGQHFGVFAQFLQKCDGNIKVLTGANKTFATDSLGRVLGWAHHKKTFTSFSYPKLSLDKTVLIVEKAKMLNSLSFTASELSPTRNKIRVEFDHTASELRFRVTEADSQSTSPPVNVEIPKTVDGTPISEGRDIQTNVNIEHLVELIKNSKSEKVELRLMVHAGENGKEKVMLRTIDEFWLDAKGHVVGGSGVEAGKEPKDAYRCKITRLMQDMG